MCHGTLVILFLEEQIEVINDIHGWFKGMSKLN